MQWILWIHSNWLRRRVLLLQQWYSRSRVIMSKSLPKKMIPDSNQRFRRNSRRRIKELIDRLYSCRTSLSPERLYRIPMSMIFPKQAKKIPSLTRKLLLLMTKRKLNSWNKWSQNQLMPKKTRVAWPNLCLTWASRVRLSRKTKLNNKLSNQSIFLKSHKLVLISLLNSHRSMKLNRNRKKLEWVLLRKLLQVNGTKMVKIRNRNNQQRAKILPNHKTQLYKRQLRSTTEGTLISKEVLIKSGIKTRWVQLPSRNDASFISIIYSLYLSLKKLSFTI